MFSLFDSMRLFNGDWVVAKQFRLNVSMHAFEPLLSTNCLVFGQLFCQRDLVGEGDKFGLATRLRLSENSP